MSSNQFVRFSMAMLLGGVAYCHPAFAAELGSGATQPASAGAGEAIPQIQEVVVTAQRREQKLQDVPIAVTAIGSSTLAAKGVSSTTELQVAVPNLVIGQDVGAITPFLRGIGSRTADVNAEPSVALYVDGVYMPSEYANFFELNNVDRVEVLKGPQGTLFGRNATGGVVQIITKPVSFTPQLDVLASYANYNTVKTGFYGSGAFTDQVAASLSLQYLNQGDGWGRNLITGEKALTQREYNGQGKVLFKPSDNTSLLLSGNYNYFNRNTVSGQPVPGSVLASGQGYPGPFNTYSVPTVLVKGRTYGGSATLDHDFGSFGFKSITAYQKYKGIEVFDQDGSPLPIVQAFFNLHTEMLSQEVHVFSPRAAKVQWLAGLYYLDYKASMDPITIAGLVFAPIGIPGIDHYTSTHVHSIAAFGQATYPLDDQTNLTAGIRYSHDWSRYEGLETIMGTNIPIDPAQTKHYKKGSPTWRVSLDHKFAPDIMGYISYNRGVKSGNISAGEAPSIAKPYNPETLDAYEIGLKTELLDRRVMFNTDVFYYDYKNIQFQKVLRGVVTTVNGPSAKLYGVESEITARATDNLTLRASANYEHTRLGNFPNAPNTRRTPIGLNDFGDPDFNAKGNRMPQAPAFSGTVGFQYDYPLEHGHIRLASDLTYAGKAYTELDNRLFVKAHELLSASLGWEGDSGLRVSLWGTNLTNTYYYSTIIGVSGLSDIGQPAAPRTYGVTIGYKFH